MKYSATALVFVAAAAMAAPHVVSRATEYGPFTPVPATRVILTTAGQTTFLVWTEEIDGRARIRIRTLGGTQPLNLPSFGDTDMLGATAASSGDEVLVVWYQQMMTTFTYFGARVAADGSLLDATPIILGSTVSAAPPRVGWDGSNFVVAWSMKGLIVTHDGLPTATLPLTSSPYTQMDAIDVGQSNGQSLWIAQGLYFPGGCNIGRAGGCAAPIGPATEAVVSQGGSTSSIALPLPATLKAHPLAVGVARDGFVVAWAWGSISTSHVWAQSRRQPSSRPHRWTKRRSGRSAPRTI